MPELWSDLWLLTIDGQPAVSKAATDIMRQRLVESGEQRADFFETLRAEPERLDSTGALDLIGFVAGLGPAEDATLALKAFALHDPNQAAKVIGVLARWPRTVENDAFIAEYARDSSAAENARTTAAKTLEEFGDERAVTTLPAMLSDWTAGRREGLSADAVASAIRTVNGQRDGGGATEDDATQPAPPLAPSLEAIGRVHVAIDVVRREADRLLEEEEFTPLERSMLTSLKRQLDDISEDISLALGAGRAAAVSFPHLIRTGAFRHFIYLAEQRLASGPLGWRALYAAAEAIGVNISALVKQLEAEGVLHVERSRGQSILHPQPELGDLLVRAGQQ